MAFHIRNCVGTRDDRSFAVQWLACALPCRRFADALAVVCARLRVDGGRSSFTVRDLHPLLLAGLPAHSENLHNKRHDNSPRSRPTHRAPPTIHSEKLIAAAIAGASHGVDLLRTGRTRRPTPQSILLAHQVRA